MENGNNRDVGDAFIFHKGSRVFIEWNENARPPPPLQIHRICSIRPDYFILIVNDSLYEARFEQSKSTLRLSFIRNSAYDVQFCKDLQCLYIVGNNGSVMAQSLLSDHQQIVCKDKWRILTFDPLELSEEGVQIKQICCSSDGVIFVSVCSDIYAIGNYGSNHTSADCYQPKLLRLFSNPVDILDVRAGTSFFVFLVRKRMENERQSYTTVNKYDELPDLVCSDMPNQREDSETPTTLDSSLLQNNLIFHGQTLLQTEIYTIGSPNNGVLGTGDHIKRDSIFAVQKLKDIGVCSVSTGNEYTIVRTIDGTFYQWGNTSVACELSSPTEMSFHTITKCNIVEASCGDRKTVFMTTQGDVYEWENCLLHHANEVSLQKIKPHRRQNSCPLLLTCSNLIIYNHKHFNSAFTAIYGQFQTQTKSMLRHQTDFLKLKRIVEKFFLKEFQEICNQWQNVLFFLAALLDSLEQLYWSDNEDVSILCLISHFRECTQILDTYSKLFCDMYSIDGFQAVQNIPQTSKNISLENINASPSVAYEGDEHNIIKIFKAPFQLFPHITQLLEKIQKYDYKYKENLTLWLEFVRKNRIDMELAENTRDFWRSNQKNAKIIHFKRKNRRVILTSSAVPIKLAHSIMGLSTHTFILFTDCLCQVGNHVTTYPLEAVWMKRDELGITIKTPEKKFILMARSQLDRDLWYDQLESSIKNILRLPEKLKIPEARNIYYHFNNHTVYAGVYAKGSFSNALMHGKCRLQFPNGKLYAGEVIHGIIEGYGRMFLPKIGLYKGHFKNGKFCGHGTLIINEKEVYEGNFRNGLFHGHGHLQHPEYVYIGEFEDNLKCGYGVLHQVITGEKYLGMFADNKRMGSGICITESGNYFEGCFANGELSGKCVAIFPNQYYYEGESSLHGPNGVGKYYMVNRDSSNQERLVADYLVSPNYENVVTGNVLCGQLSGKWENVKINNGSMEINEKFSQYPSTLGAHVVNNKHKWCSLFTDFEYEIFDDLSSSRNNSKAITFALWNRVVAFVNKQQEIEHEKMTDLDIVNGKSYCRDWSILELDTADKLSLNSTNFCYDQQSEMNKCHSQSQDTLLHGWDFYNLDLLSSFASGKVKCQSNEDPANISKFSKLIEIMESHGTTVDSFNDSALDNSDMMDDCISLQTEMDLIPSFGMSDLSDLDLDAIKSYLNDAFRYRYHPLKHLKDRITQAFYRSYGCWKMKPTPLLAKQAMREWESISQRVYKFIRRLFPALPEEYCLVGEQKEVLSHVTLLYPILLSENIYSMLFVLYANQYSHKDEIYRQNIIQAEKLSDEELIKRLDFDRDLLGVIKAKQFAEAIEMLNKLKEKYSPIAMLTVIENCMEKLTQAHKAISRDTKNSFNADIIMPLTLVLLLRAGIHHLGAELALLDDLTDGKNFQSEMNGIRGYCLTTLKASYEHLANKTSLLETK
ncbi:amyotrophic lateral sclerosis 2 [Musca autumnalis]|uniref:amyotrophic lateral sclerosis 2 n=1 Tax=Musca autumnalis TaxID=221902 RepID=UPI003CF7E028